MRAQARRRQWPLPRPLPYRRISIGRTPAPAVWRAPLAGTVSVCDLGSEQCLELGLQ